jgi:tetratricopeptide (TPR) repeat protein
LFDFGLYLPANAMLMAALCGMVVGRAALLSVWPPAALQALDRPVPAGKFVVRPAADLPAVAHQPITDDRRLLLGATHVRRHLHARPVPVMTDHSWLLGLAVPTALVALLIGFLLVGCLSGSLELSRAGRIEAARRRADLTRLQQATTPEAMQRAAAPLIAALPQRWDDAQAHEQLALVYLLQYQAETYRELVDQAAPSALQSDSEPAERPVDSSLWARASVAQLHRAVRQQQRAGDQAAADALRQRVAVQQLLLPAARHFLAARKFAPTVARVHYRLAELTPVAPAVGDEVQLLHNTQLLSPGDAMLWFASGMLHLDSGRTDDACRCWHESLLLSRRFLPEIVEAAEGNLTVRQLLDQVLPRQADLLLLVARTHFAAAEQDGLRQSILARAAAAFPMTQLSPAELLYTRGAILKDQGNRQEAVPFYVDAVSRQSNNLAWRMELAQLLIELEQFDQAQEHVAYLHNAQPESAAYRQLLEDFNRRRWRKGAPEGAGTSDR